jgi:hypothetical protein
MTDGVAIGEALRRHASGGHRLMLG